MADKSKRVDPGRNTTNAEASSTIRAQGRYAPPGHAKQVGSKGATRFVTPPTERGYYRKGYNPNRGNLGMTENQRQVKPPASTYVSKQAPVNKGPHQQRGTTSTMRGGGR